MRTLMAVSLLFIILGVATTAYGYTQVQPLPFPLALTSCSSNGLPTILITISVTGSGTISFAGGTPQSNGSFQTCGNLNGVALQANAGSGYNFAGWSQPGFGSTITCSNCASTTINLGSQSITIAATFSTGTVSTTTQACSEQGTFSVGTGVGSITVSGIGTFLNGGSGSFPCGQSYALTANPPGGYTFAPNGWTIAGAASISGNTNPTTVNIGTSLTGTFFISVAFVSTATTTVVTSTSSSCVETLNPIVPQNGVISLTGPNPSGGSYNNLVVTSALPVGCNNGYAITGSGFNGYTFQGWTVSGAGACLATTGNSCTSVSSSASTTLSSGSGNGGSFSLTLNLNSPTTTSVTSTTSTATCMVTGTFSVNVGQGTITVDGNTVSPGISYQVPCNTTHTISATAGNGYVFQLWGISGAVNIGSASAPTTSLTTSATSGTFQVTVTFNGGTATTSSVSTSMTTTTCVNYFGYPACTTSSTSGTTTTTIGITSSTTTCSNSFGCTTISPQGIEIVGIGMITVGALGMIVSYSGRKRIIPNMPGTPSLG